MTQTSELLLALKRCLRAHGHTYRDLAVALDLSEASVKRLFSEQSFTVKRLEQACRFLDMNIHELSRLTRMHEEAEPRELSLAQEQALAADPDLLLAFYLLINGWKPYQVRADLGSG